LDVAEMVREFETVRANVVSEQRVLRLSQAWLALLRDAYSTNKGAFSNEQLRFLKRVSAAVPYVRRFIEVQEELAHHLDVQEYNEGMQELHSMAEQFKDFAVAKRVQKEIRELVERRNEVLQYEQTRGNTRLSTRILALEENAPIFPRSDLHRLADPGGQREHYFWGCSAFLACWYSRSLSSAEIKLLDS
jgi:hypothetical protein